jgi:hypothetical protein
MRLATSKASTTPMTTKPIATTNRRGVSGSPDPLVISADGLRRNGARPAEKVAVAAYRGLTSASTHAAATRTAAMPGIHHHRKRYQAASAALASNRTTTSRSC